jgi:hypothetical protein
MTIKKTAAIVLGGAVLILLFLIFLAGGVDYPDTDTSELDRDQLFLQTEKLLEEAKTWPAELTADSVVVASSLEPYPVRTVWYSFDLDAPLEKVF